MKEGAPLFFVFYFVIIALLAPCGLVAAGQSHKVVDIDNVLRESTFHIQELTKSRKVANDYHAYFQDDGILVIKFSKKHWKYERWKVDDKGTLCMTTIARKVGKTTLYTSKCGRFVRSSDTAFRWYDGDGRYRANFNFKGKGDRLPGLGLQAARDANVVLAAARATAKARNAKKRELRPRPFKRRK